MKGGILRYADGFRRETRIAHIKACACFAMAVMMLFALAYFVWWDKARKGDRARKVCARPDIVDVQYIPAAWGQQQETILRFEDGSSAILNGHHNAKLMRKEER